MGVKLDALSAVIGRSWEKSVSVGVTLSRGSMEGKVGTTVGEGAGSVCVGMGVGILGICWQETSIIKMSKGKYLLKNFIRVPFVP
jgi:hypothetical protein